MYASCPFKFIFILKYIANHSVIIIIKVIHICKKLYPIIYVFTDGIKYFMTSGIFFEYPRKVKALS